MTIARDFRVFMFCRCFSCTPEQRLTTGILQQEFKTRSSVCVRVCGRGVWGGGGGRRAKERMEERVVVVVVKISFVYCPF